MRLPWRVFGGDKRDDNAKNFAAEKIVKYRAIFMALDVSPQNASAAVPAVQSDPKTKRGNSHQRRRQGRRETRETASPKIVAAEKSCDIPHDYSHGAWSRCE